MRQTNCGGVFFPGLAADGTHRSTPGLGEHHATSSAQAPAERHMIAAPAGHTRKLR